MSHWSPGQTLESVEKIVIQAAYQFYHRNKTQTAASLGISIRTLDTKLEKYDADRRVEEASVAKRRAEIESHLARSRGLSRTASGVLLESSTPAVAQHTVSMPKREEVQEVLQRGNSEGRTKRVGKTA